MTPSREYDIIRSEVIARVLYRASPAAPVRRPVRHVETLQITPRPPGRRAFVLPGSRESFQRTRTAPADRIPARPRPRLSCTLCASPERAQSPDRIRISSAAYRCNTFTAVLRRFARYPNKYMPVGADARLRVSARLLRRHGSNVISRPANLPPQPPNRVQNQKRNRIILRLR